MGFGAIIGALSLYVIYIGIVFAAPSNPWMARADRFSIFIPVVVYLAVAILLAVRRRTSLFGAGLLIGLGTFTLLGGGLCVAVLSRAPA